MTLKKVRLILAEDQFLLQQGLIQVFNQEPNIDIVGEVFNAKELFELAEKLNPDVILFKADLKDLKVEEIVELKKSRPQIQFIVLTKSEHPLVPKLIQAGVVGYLAPSFDRQQLVRAVEISSEGKIFLHPEFAQNILEKLKSWLSLQSDEKEQEKVRLLTKREKEVLTLVAQGMDNLDIARQLYISEKTVRNHLSNTFRKLDFRDRTQAALWAVRVGIVAIQDSPYL